MSDGFGGGLPIALVFVAACFVCGVVMEVAAEWYCPGNVPCAATSTGLDLSLGWSLYSGLGHGLQDFSKYYCCCVVNAAACADVL